MLINNPTTEPNLHLENTKSHTPYFVISDTNRDNIVDKIYEILGYKVPYSSDTDDAGVFTPSHILSLGYKDSDKAPIADY